MNATKIKLSATELDLVTNAAGQTHLNFFIQ
jgi:hypothetical protein